MGSKELIIENVKLKMDKWEIKKIKEFAYTRSGGTPRRSEKSYWNGEIPWLKSGELNDNTCITENSEFITKKGLEESSAKLFPKGTLLLAMYGATAGKLGILGMDATTNQAVCSIQNNQGLFEEKYLYKFLLFKRDEIIRDSFGGAQPNISKTYIDNIKVPLPPLSEQRRIASKLDALFAEIDASLALIDQNIAQAEALKLSVLDEEFGKIRKEEKLVKVAEFRPKKAEVRELNELKCSFLPMKDLNENKIDFEPQEIRKIGEVYKGYTYFRDNDVLLAKVTPCFQNRKAGVAKNLINGIGFGSSEYFVFRPSDRITSEYLYYFLVSADFINKGVANMSGAVGLKRVTTQYINNTKIPLPDLNIQKKVVNKIENTFSEIDALILDYTQKRENLEALKSSLLDQAFKGEL